MDGACPGNLGVVAFDSGRWNVARMVRRAGIVLAILVMAAGCRSASSSAEDHHDSDAVVASEAYQSDIPLSAEPVNVVVANSPGTLLTGSPQRLMVALVDPSGIGYLGSGLDPVEMVISPLQAAGDGGQRLEADWLSADAANLGLYITYPTFDGPGSWEIRIESAGQDVGGTIVEVVERSIVPLIGASAPRSPTATSSDNGVFDLSVISTDPQPNPDFYRLSLDEALDNGRPTVVAFATPAFCQTALCGPTLETVKAATDGRADLDVVHVEPFDLDQARQGTLAPSSAMIEWNLPTEPWVFVVDGDGVVTAALEGIFSETELRQAIDDDVD